MAELTGAKTVSGVEVEVVFNAFTNPDSFDGGTPVIIDVTWERSGYPCIAL